MKILLISPSIYPVSFGGLEIYNYYFIKELKKIGIHISLLSNHSKKFPVKIPKFKLYTTNTLFRSFQILFHLVIYKYDIIHIPYASNSFLAYPFVILKLFFKKNNYIIYIHGGGMHKWKSEIIQKLFFEKAKVIMSVSDPIKLEYEKRVTKKIHTILPLIPFEKTKKSKEQLRNEFGIKKIEKLLIYVGSIKPIKGSDFLVNSLLKLGKEFFSRYNLKMFFIGDGILKNDLAHLVEMNEMQNEIQFLGWRLKSELPNYLHAADIFVFASQFEGTPLSLLEAIYNELLVVATNVTGINNIIKHKYNGLLFSLDDFESFRHILEFAVSNPLESTKMINNAKNITLKNFNYKKNILKHLELYKG